MNGIPKENNLRSVSLYALSVVDITFDQDTDRNFARQQVFNRVGRPRPAERRRAGCRAADLAVGPDLPLHAAEPRPLADRAQDLRGLDGRAAISVGPRGRRRFRASAAARCNIRCCSTSIGSPAPACRRSRSKARSAPTTATAAADSIRRAANSITSAASAGCRRSTTSAMSWSPSTTASRRWSRTSARSRSASRRASASSGSASRTTPSKASSCCAPARRRRTC